MTDEMTAARNFIFDKLAASSDITDLIGGAANPRIFQEVAEPEALYPLVLIQSIPPISDSLGASRDLLFANPFFRVIGCVNKRTFATVGTLANEIFNALHRQSGNSDGRHILSAWRVAPHNRSFTDNGITYAVSGGDYRLEVQ